MRRVWKPLDLAPGFRLYEVRSYFQQHPGWNESHIVAASSPIHATEIWWRMHEGTEWIEKPVVTGHALNICQPAEWWEGEAPRSTPLAVKRLCELLEAYRAKRAVDGGGSGTGYPQRRLWNASKHYDADVLIEQLESTLGKEIDVWLASHSTETAS